MTIMVRPVNKGEVFERGNVVVDEKHLVIYVVVLRYKPDANGERRYMLACIDEGNELCMYFESEINCDNGWLATTYEIREELYDKIVECFAIAVGQGIISVDMDTVDW